MPNRLEEDEAVKIPKAPDKLIDPFKEVVSIAMQKVREGVIDSSNRQMVHLLDEENSRSYIIEDVLVEASSRVVKSKGSLGLGLFIDVFQLKEEGRYEIVYRMQLPRSQDLVTRETLSSLRENNPKDVKMLAKALSSAKKL